MRLTTYEDVKNAIPRGIRQGEIAGAMGYDSGAFSHGLALDPRGKPSEQFKARFKDALTSLTQGTPA